MSYPSQQLTPYSPYQQGDLLQLRLIEHIGALIFWQQRSYTFTGTLEQCEAAYRRAQTQNLLAGWWSIASLFLLNWIALVSNLSAMGRLRSIARGHLNHVLPASVPTAGWYADPSGAPAQRYWDGSTWTHWTHPTSHR